MERTTISLPRDLIVKLRIMAAERRTSMAAIIREVVEKEMREKLASETEKPYKRPELKSLGFGASKYTDTAAKAGDMKFEPPGASP